MPTTSRARRGRTTGAIPRCGMTAEGFIPILRKFGVKEDDEQAMPAIA